MCSTIDPTATHATAQCTRVKAKPHGYHWKTFITPVLTWNRAEPIRTATEPRSTACTTPRTGGHSNSLRYTENSLASSSGTQARPVATWVPWLSR